MRLWCAAGVSLLVVSATVSGCGQAEQVIRKLDVKEAAAWIEDAPAVRATVSIDATPAALGALARDLGDGDHLTLAGLQLDDPAVADVLAGAGVVVVGAPGGNPTDALTATTLQAGGVTLVELVSGGREVFARIDAQRLAAYLPARSPLARKDPAALALVLDLVAPGTGELLRGGWAAADAGAVERWAGPRFAGLVTGGGQTMPVLARAFEAVVRKATLAEDPAQPGHTVMTITGEDLRAALGERAPADLPPSIALDAYTVDGRLERLSLDLTQFTSAAKGSTSPDRAPVRISVRLAEATPVRPPADARRLELTGLPTLAELIELARRGQRLPEPP